ncbi:MAG: zinc-binding dehydrogenase [Myxococcales bacterium]|nr:zinc-binding dehydrogenase [Myxococcales bacterium]
MSFVTTHATRPEPSVGPSKPISHRVVVARHGGPEVLTLVETPIPEPGPGEVRIRVLAAGVSAYDLMFRRSGALPGTPRLPFTPGEDVVGIVDAIGPGVSTLEVGRRVAGYTRSLGVGGGYAEHLCLGASELVAVPEGVDPAEAVCVVVNYLTAHAALEVAGTKPGERVLVQGAGGGVGSALLDLGRAAGLTVYGTASHHNHDLVRAFGATPIDYHHEDVVTRIHALAGDGVDVVFDPVGGARQIWRSYQTLRPGGRLVWFGVAASKRRGLRVIPTSFAMRGVLGLIPGRRVLTVDLDKGNAWYRRALTELLRDLAAHKLTPIVAARIPLAEADQAHRLLEQGEYGGKVVLLTRAGEAASRRARLLRD